jgi:hypothetical protein
MAFTALSCDESSTFYAINDAGDLLFYRDLARDGSVSWSHGGVGAKIGTDWRRFRDIIAGRDGVIYAIDGEQSSKPGQLLFYRDLARDGTSRWAFGGTGQVISDGGWNRFIKVFSGGDGILYAIAPNGDLLYYRDEARDGTRQWSYGGIPQRIGTGWNEFRDVAYGGNGVIYAIASDGRLLWYQDLTRNGTMNWAHDGVGQPIGEGWTSFARFLSGQDGVLYGISPDGFLLFYRDLVQDGSRSWAFGGVGQRVGSGWFLTPQETDVEGYCVPLSVPRGGSVAFHVSARSGYSVQIQRLKSQPNGDVGVPMRPAFARQAQVQETPPVAWRDGCGWSESFNLGIPDSWPSGLYSARCTADSGTVSDIVFVVRPGTGTHGDFAVLANTNTWNAYNSWGGQSKYSEGFKLSFERPNPGASPIDDGQPNHQTRAELWTLNWLENEGYTFDVYSDLDLHQGIVNLASYKALILSTHPEYWTDRMRDALEIYLSGGGHLVYLGGNGLFERCEFEDGNSSLLFWGGDPSLGRERNFFRNADPPRPERATLGVAFVFNNHLSVSAPGPYRVIDASHRFFAGTGLTNGDQIGAFGRNGAASGWEIDISNAGTARDGEIVTAWVDNDRGAPPAGLQLLAVGQNQPTEGWYGAHMTHYCHSGGGFVFSVGSLCFTGSLAVDPVLQRIVRNVLDETRTRKDGRNARMDVRCVDFRRFSAGPGPNPRAEQGLVFRAFNAQSQPLPQTNVQPIGPLIGLDCGSRIEIDVPGPVPMVELSVVTAAALGNAEAYNSSGNLLASVTMNGPRMMPETLRIAGDAIRRVIITAPQNETRLLEFCSLSSPSTNLCCCCQQSEDRDVIGLVAYLKTMNENLDIRTSVFADVYQGSDKLAEDIRIATGEVEEWQDHGPAPIPFERPASNPTGFSIELKYPGIDSNTDPHWRMNLSLEAVTVAGRRRSCLLTIQSSTIYVIDNGGQLNFEGPNRNSGRIPFLVNF